MIENLLKEHEGEITSLLSKYGLQGSQASSATNTIIQAISGFIGAQASTGKLDLNHLMDLFNPNTPNQSNSIFGGLSQTVSNALNKDGVNPQAASQISTGGLDEILKIFQNGVLKNVDSSTITNLVSMLSGKEGDLGGMLGKLGGLFGKN